MTDAEQSAIALAYLQDRIIQYYSNRLNAWYRYTGSVFHDKCAYRIDPEHSCKTEPRRIGASEWQPIETAPKQELVLVCGLHHDGTWWFNVGTLWGNEWDGPWLYSLRPIYWMPLAEPLQ